MAPGSLIDLRLAHLHPTTGLPRPSDGMNVFYFRARIRQNQSGDTLQSRHRWGPRIRARAQA
jgi:hypothetical protein